MGHNMGMQFKSKDCVHVLEPLFKIGKAGVYGGGSTEYKYFARNMEDKLGLTLCLSKYDEFKLQSVNLLRGKLPNGLMKYTVDRYPGDVYLSVDWPDMGYPGLPKQFWTGLVDFIKSDIKKAVFVHCMGGHGRTGTALAIMAHMVGACKDEDPVLWLRDVYCKQVVESDKQIDYIIDILGINIEADVSKSWGTGWPSGGSGTRSYGYSSTGLNADTPDDSAGDPDYDRTKGFKELLEDAKGIRKAAEHDAIQQELWDDDHVYFDTGSKWYVTAWGDRLAKKYEKAEKMLKKIKSIVEKEYKK